MSTHRMISTRRFLLSSLAVVGLSAVSGMAAVPSGLAPLVGTWSGSGSIKLDSGQTEVVRCKVYYADKSGNLGVALRCASAASKIDLRATLVSTGSKVSGTWEERQFNASGALAGAVSGNKMSLDMVGGGMKATVVVATTGANQTLSIVTETGGFRSVTIAFARD